MGWVAAHQVRGLTTRQRTDGAGCLPTCSGKGRRPASATSADVSRSQSHQTCITAMATTPADGVRIPEDSTAQNARRRDMRVRQPNCAGKAILANAPVGDLVRTGISRPTCHPQCRRQRARSRPAPPRDRGHQQTGTPTKQKASTSLSGRPEAPRGSASAPQERWERAALLPARCVLLLSRALPNRRDQRGGTVVVDRTKSATASANAAAWRRWGS
jgi:hypothetical protein